MKKILTTLSFSALALASSQAAIVWQAGAADNGQANIFTNRPHTPPNAGGVNVEYTREIGGSTALPGNAASMGGDDNDALRDIDDDYYFAGNYVTTVGSAYTGVGIVASDEIAMERAWTGGDNEMRYHFNLAPSTTSTDLLTIGFGLTGSYHNPDPGVNGETTWDITIAMNGVTIGTQALTSTTGNADFTSPSFNIGTVGGAAVVGSDYDNYVTLSATKTGGTGNWVSLDYANLDVTPVPEPSSLGLLAIAAAGLTFIRRRR